ncbi:MAG: phospholipase [Deltaproteobacteria bacterium]|nr:phospholipase [Deltaproteobacteria bacterium]MDQ3299283.1 phospholipase D-like domain-containing protein [Myxococcota bacterium]
MTQILIPGLTCAQVFSEPRSDISTGVLADGHDFYKALYVACLEAKRTILMAGWQFASKVELLRGDDATDCGHPTRLVDFLADLCEARPDLDIYMLAWDASPIFTFEREPLQRLMFQCRGHKRIHYVMDNAHPTGASHHQKLVLVDRAIAFTGGMDVCNSRWDDRDHKVDSPHRCEGKKPYAPYHDVQAYVTGDPVDVLREWFCERWERATGKPLQLPDVPRTEIAIEPSFDVTAPTIALTRTWPRMEEPPTAPIKEIYELHLRAIAAAERLIYIENQYLSCNEIGDAIERRMRGEGDRKLDIVIVLPEKSAGFKERISIGIYQQRILERLGEVARETGHRLGVYYSCDCGKRGEVPVFIHAKVLAVDDRFLLVSSANTSNRSMGFDTELGLAWEAPTPTDSLRAARLELLAEHAGVPRAEADARFGEPEGLVARLDDLARAKSHKLRIHRRNVDEKPGWLLRKLLPDGQTPFDPDDPKSFEEAMPEPEAWLDRVIRDPLVFLARGGRNVRARFAHRKLKA